METFYMWYFRTPPIQSNQSGSICLVKLQYHCGPGDYRRKLPLLFTVWPHVPGSEIIYLGGQL